MEIPGEGIINLHFQLSMIIGGTKGHDDVLPLQLSLQKHLPNGP